MIDAVLTADAVDVGDGEAGCVRDGVDVDVADLVADAVTLPVWLRVIDPDMVADCEHDGNTRLAAQTRRTLLLLRSARGDDKKISGLLPQLDAGIRRDADSSAPDT